jgi:glyoxylase-like metal-dependent hydrolase (beta-lactamase superfamily II)
VEIADGVFLFRGRSGKKLRRGAGSVNVTIVRGDALAMLDTGVIAGGAFRDLVAGIEADGLDLRRVAWVAHTHSHWDHINAAGVMKNVYGAKLAAGAAEVPLIEDRERNFRGFLADFGSLAPEVFPYPQALARFLSWLAWGRQPLLRVDRALHDGDLIDLGRPVEAVGLPGHTTGHTGYFVRDAGVLASGDLIDFENAQGMDLNNPRSDYAAALRSLERAIQLEPEILIPAHGEPTVGRSQVREVLEGALDGGLEYPGRIREALSGRPMRAVAITRRVFPEIPFSMEAMTAMLVLVVLLHMEKTESARRVTHAGRPAWVRAD